MKIIRFEDLEFIPASHENPQNPGVLKKILLKRDDLPAGRMQMINWCKLLTGKGFAPHYHESMIEVFIIMNGKVKATIDNEVKILEKGDCVIALEKQVHVFENICYEDVYYLCLGLVTAEGGKSVNA